MVRLLSWPGRSQHPWWYIETMLNALTVIRRDRPPVKEGLHDTRPTGDRWGTPVSKGEEDLCTGVGRPHQKVFKLTLNGEGEESISSDARVNNGLGTMAEPGNGQVEVRPSYTKKVVGLVAQLKCFYTNAGSMGNKQEELEAIVQQESYDVVAIMETWWDDSHDWSAAMDGYKLFRRDRQGRRGEGVALYVRESYECRELIEGNSRVECLWVRIRGRASKTDIVVGVCYRPPNQDLEVDDIFYKQLGEVSRSLALLLVGDFNLPDINWAHNTAEREQSRRFLECVEDNFLTQLVRELTREGALLDLLFVNREGLVGDVMVEGCLGHSDHEMIEFSGKQGGDPAGLPPWTSGGQTLVFARACLTESLGRQP
ncbi:adaptin ear-binding coat-associated protein 1 [Limosa lapponica baueri]|uniref:Adaptin ear-binding coat-associated protein 1 n=1 Tax=Limosa lapponica baueri TaxID=1758121 RepID=A0A2I0TEV0_LIMLA|nr:adaptin ear-binding coat-associated protein 1 [Limosa lapponica baueri]